MKNNNDLLRLRERQPLYIQAIDALTQMIETGQLKPGAQLSAENELAAKLDISRSTLREALRHLETLGLISRRQGVGTFVSIPTGPGFFGGLERLEPFRYLARVANKKHSLVQKKGEMVKASRKLAAVMGAMPGIELVRVQTIEAIDGIPCVYFDDYFINTRGLAEKLTSYDDSVLVYMFKSSETPLTHTRSEIYAIEAPEDVAIHNALHDKTYESINLGIHDGKIVRVSHEEIPPGDKAIDAKGAMISPALIESHFHIENALLWETDIVTKSGTLREAIDIYAKVKVTLDTENIVHRASIAIHDAIAHGTLWMRNHVDIDQFSKLSLLRSVVTVREKFKNVFDLQIIAFPQHGLARHPDALDRLWQGMDKGAPLGGGTP